MSLLVFLQMVFAGYVLTRLFNMSQRTPLHQSHLDANAKLVDFHGWELPIHYGSQIDEHLSVRKTSGMFDVSHMTVIDISGSHAGALLRQLLSNDVAKLADWQALYSCMCNEAGGVIDDLMVYKLATDRFRLIANAGTRNKDLDWIQQHSGTDVVVNMVEDSALLAVQGPESESTVSELVQALGLSFNLKQLKKFTAVQHKDWFIGRTGYTGEDGFELLIPSKMAATVFAVLLEHGVSPCGLGARDTLRLEAGMCLYGQDLDEQHTPVESGIAWTVDITDSNREFIGRTVLQQQKLHGTAKHQIALELNQRGVMRAGQEIAQNGKTVGSITSGSFSPTLQKSIALARVSEAMTADCTVLMRNKAVPVTEVTLPFVRS